MARQISLSCECGNALAVTEAQAGSSTKCVKCAQTVSVPSLSTLREMAGQNNPYLSHWGQLAYAASDRQHPFAGCCQTCEAAATIEVPLAMTRIVERDCDSDGGAVVSPLFVSMTIAGSTDVVETVTIPLLFCNRCYTSFRRWYVWEGLRLLILVPTLVIGGVVAFVVARIVGLMAFGILFVLLARAFGSRRIGRRWESRLSRISLVSDAIAQESDLRFRLGQPQSIVQHN